MWSSRLFWKLFLFYSALNLLATVTFVSVVAGWQRDQVVSQVKQRLHDSCVLVRSDIENAFEAAPSAALQSHIYRLGHAIDTRITLVAVDGQVLADSEKQSFTQVLKMANHKNRPELIQAAASGDGYSQRVSPTMGEPLLYYALRADRNGQPIGLVRTAFSIKSINAEVAQIQQFVWFVAFLASLSVLALTYILVGRIVYPVTALTQAAESIAKGDHPPDVQVTNQDELGALARAFNRMWHQLSARESQLRESNERLETVLDGMVEGVIAIGAYDQIIFANKAAGQLIGFGAEQSVGRLISETTRNQALYDLIGTARESGSRQHAEIELGDTDSRVVAINSTILPAEPQSRVILVLHDVTELRRLESLRAEFAANVSHELKTPLSSIKAYAETLSGGAINDTSNNLNFVRRIEEQAERLHQLILDLLSLSQIESGKQAFDISSVSLQNVIRTCVSEQSASAAAKGVRLVVEGESHDIQVLGDEDGVFQLLNNLVDNALKYTPSGGQVTIGWSSGTDQVRIEVRDTGIGIPAEQLSRVFERFYRVDKARSRELGGTGLGLSIVKHLAQAFGGSVSVESELGSGSTFSVTLVPS